MIDLARFSSTPKCNEFVELSAKIADLKPAIARAASAWDHFGLKIAENWRKHSNKIKIQTETAYTNNKADHI